MRSMHNPFLLHPKELRQSWKDLRASLDGFTDLVKQLQLVSDFWNQAPIGKPYLNYLDPESWPDPWLLIDSKILDRNSLSLGMFYTIMLANNAVKNKNIKLAMIRQPSISWEGLVCTVDDSWIIGYDRDKVCNIDSIPDMLVMHMYKYDLHKRCVTEIKLFNSSSYHA